MLKHPGFRFRNEVNWDPKTAEIKETQAWIPICLLSAGGTATPKSLCVHCAICARGKRFSENSKGENVGFKKLHGEDSTV